MAGASAEVTVVLTARYPAAWRHQCGHLNDGAYRDGAVCSGCRFEVPAEHARRGDVEARYFLVEIQ